MVAMKFKATLGSWSGVGVVLYMLYLPDFKCPALHDWLTNIHTVRYVAHLWIYWLNTIVSGLI